MSIQIVDPLICAKLTKNRYPVHIILTSQVFGVRSSYFHTFLFRCWNDSYPTRFVSEGNRIAFFTVVIYIRNMYKSYYKYQQWKPLSCYPRVWNRYPTYFQNVYERVYFWTFQHLNKKVWKYELLTPKTREVRMMWTGVRFFFQFCANKGGQLFVWTLNQLS